MEKRENYQTSANLGTSDTNQPVKSAKTARKPKTSRFKAKLLATYYGNPLKDMKLIVVTGTTGKIEVAHYVHEILKATGQPVAIFAAPSKFKLSTLYKFFSEAWKAGANYVVVTAPAETIASGTFATLPVHIAAMTNLRTNRLTYTNPEEELYASSTQDNVSPESTFKTTEEYYDAVEPLFTQNPDYVILNRDDANFDHLATVAGVSGTILYGSDRTSHIQIASSKLYRKGTEASLNIGGNRFVVASFLTGEPVVSYMACATAIADALHIAPEKITEGIAEYNPTAPEN